MGNFNLSLGSLLGCSRGTTSAHERQHFESASSKIIHLQRGENGSLLDLFTDREICHLVGAPSGSDIKYAIVKTWGNTGADNPPPGLYFEIRNSKYIDGKNVVGIVDLGDGVGHQIYIKDVHFKESAPPGMVALMLKRMVGFCQRKNISRISLLAAGGRLWPSMGNGERWGGYYAWARLGFDMELEPKGIAQHFSGGLHYNLFSLFPFFPDRLDACATVQDVIQVKGGLDWWRSCGSGWFMEFECTQGSKSATILDKYLKSKGF
jgi:hypothetical protein